MNARRYDVVSLTALASSLFAGALVRDRLPERVATHFDFRGNADGWMARDAALLLLPTIGLALWALMRLSPRVLPRAERARLGPTNLALVAAMTSVFLGLVHVGLLAHALDPAFSITKAVYLGVGGLFVGLGLVMPRVRRNALLGVRTAWTLASDENWARTHRVAGYAMVAGGVVAALSGTFGGAVGAVVALTSLVLAGLVPAAYSLVLARRTDAS